MASPAAFGQIFLLPGPCPALASIVQASYRAFCLMWVTPERLWGLLFCMGEMIYIPFYSQTHSKSEVNVYPGFEQSFIPIIIPLNIGGLQKHQRVSGYLRGGSDGLNVC